MVQPGKGTSSGSRFHGIQDDLMISATRLGFPSRLPLTPVLGVMALGAAHRLHPSHSAVGHLRRARIRLGCVAQAIGKFGG